ncbi:hypothetical protein Taro_031420 [Colocasia esculenta]|uniref:C2H2-type domain-containing protein n=1 Tax=Colocasia esculenta TaxID=4460 RepID=A0A843VPZ4_COLES|nr:hypothetical protein [Colocasia esculenta]
MDRHTCKLCFRRFSNGRALGGHMRSHVASATMAAMKAQLQDLSPSPSSSSSASHGQQEAAELEAEVAEQEAAAAAEAGMAVGGEAKQLAYYGLRENPRKSYRLVDPEFSSTFAAADYAAAAAAAGSSVVLQDRESETESSKPPPLRRRSSRRRRFRAPQLPPPGPEASFEPEPVSSVSDTTPEEDVARCLMILSRDVWTTTDSSTAEAKRRKTHRDVVAEEEEDEGEEEEQQLDAGSEEERVAVVRSRKGGRRRYQCGTCGKVFRSYQALGGHRASHKNARACAAAPSPVRFPTHAHAEVAFEEEKEYEHGDGHLGHQIHDTEVNAFRPAVSTDRRVHECPVCFRVFGSGQALGGHKRSHLAYSSSSMNPSVLLPSHAAASDVAAATAASASAATATGGGPCPGGTNFTRKFAGESLIDLNLPAPMDEEVEMSAVFDAEQ